MVLTLDEGGRPRGARGLAMGFLPVDKLHSCDVEQHNAAESCNQNDILEMFYYCVADAREHHACEHLEVSWTPTSVCQSLRYPRLPSLDPILSGRSDTELHITS
jgi:hypothetical protein